LRQLTECNANGCFALGAFELSDDGKEQGVIGVARDF
jgi:hypothetical protein